MDINEFRLNEIKSAFQMYIDNIKRIQDANKDCEEIFSWTEFTIISAEKFKNEITLGGDIRH